jgi:MFS family permease
MRTGVDFLPLVAAVTLSASVASARLLAKTGPKPLIPVGMVLAMMGMVLLTRLTLHSTYLGGVLPGLILIGLGMGLIFAPAVASATAGIDSADAGAASALTNVVQQVGGSVGTALLNTIAVSVATRYVTAHQPTTALVVERASIHGYGVAFWWGAAIFGFGAIVTYFVLEAGVPEFEGDVVPLI